MKGARARKSRPFRALVKIAVAGLSTVLSLWALYIVLANVFLSTSLFERIVNGDPETIDIHYRRGWSFIPGYVHAERLSIRGSDSNVEWILRIDEVDFVVSLPKLLHQRFDVGRVRGSGITFRLRQKMPSPLLIDDYVGELPQIPGFDRLPIRPPDPPSPERWSDEVYNLWTIQLSDVIANDVREIWFDRERFEGRARVSGGFYLKPIREAWVGPVLAEYFEGRITMSSRPVAEDLLGRFKIRVAAFDPRIVDGDELLHRLSVRTDLAFRIPDIDNMRQLRESGIGLEGAADVERLFLRVDDGFLKDASHVHVAMPDAKLRQGDHRIRASVEARGDVYASRLALSSAMRNTRLSRASDELARIATMDVTGDSGALDLGKPLTDLHFVAAARGVEAPDARAWNHALAKTPLTFLGGHARGSAEIEAWLAEHRVRGHAAVDARAVEAKVSDAHVHGDVRATASVGSLAWDTAQMRDVVVSAVVASGELTTGHEAKKASLAVDGLQVDARARELDGNDPLRSFDASAVLRHGELTLASGHGRFTARGAIVVRDRRARGSVEASSALIALALGDSRFSAAVTARARVHDWALDEGHLAVDEASADLTDVVGWVDDAVRVPSLTVSRARVTASSRRFRFAEPLADVDLAARIEHGEIRNAEAIDRLLGREPGKGLGFEPGPASFEADAVTSVRANVARGHVAARVGNIGVAGDKIHMRANVDAAADVESLDLRSRELALGGARITVTNLSGRFQPSGAPDFSVRNVELTGGKGVVDLAHPSAFGLDLRLRVDEAQLRDARSLDAFLSPGGKLAFESGFARGRADVTISPQAKSAHGSVEVRITDLGVRHDKTRVGGSVEALAEIRGFDPETGAIDLSGSRIALRDVRTSGSASQTLGWKGDLLLTEGAVRVGDVPGFDGHVQFVAEDAAPILAVALGKSVPKFLVDLLRAPHLVAQADILVAPRVLAVRNVRAHGDDVALRGDYVVRNDVPSGALVVSKGPLSAGVGIDHDGASLKLFGLDAWLGAEVRRASNLLRAP